MHVLITAASKHGATHEIASWLAEAIRTAGLGATIREPEELTALDGFDAVILGSGVYAGKWLGDATKLVDRLGPEFRARPVWLFSSGPAGDPLKPEADPADVAPMQAATGARGHRVFPGRIDRSALGFAEWAIVATLRVPNGDYRSRADVEGWGRQIARELSATVTAVEAGSAVG